MKRLLLIVLVTVTVACSPTTASPTVLSVSGRVASDATPLSGATVTIMDGVNAGQTRMTDAAGDYSFTDLTPSRFTLQAAAAGHTPQNKLVDLTASSQTVWFSLFHQYGE
jgi:iron complex outermembrane recepter protein